jgi:AcrR family transcriptional regulator
VSEGRRADGRAVAWNSQQRDAVAQIAVWRIAAHAADRAGGVSSREVRSRCAFRTDPSLAPRRMTPTLQLVPRRRKLPADERAREILDMALELFADKGFGASLQELADRIGVTQPLLLRYYPTKAALIDRCKQEVMGGHWRPEWRAGIADRSRPLHERIEAFYRDYLPRIYRRVWYRMFMFSAISDPGFAQAYLQQVTDEVLATMLYETRHELGYGPLKRVPLHERELELAWGLHSTFAFLGMRTLVYEMAKPTQMEAMVRDQVRIYLLGARELMAELHATTARRYKPR